MALVVILTTVMVAFAAPGERERGTRGRQGNFEGKPDMQRGQHGPGIERLAETLGLTPEQTEQIEQIKAGAADAMKDAGQAQKELHQQLSEAAKAGDETVIRGIASQIADQIVTQTMIRVRVHNAILGVLTPEQAEQFEARMAEMKERREEMGPGKRGGRGPEMAGPRPGMRPQQFGPQKKHGPQGQSVRPQGPRGGGMDGDRVDQLFQNADLDGDGFLTQEELKEFFESRKAEQGGHGERKPK